MNAKAKSKVAVLDDYDGSISRLECWKSLNPDFAVDFFHAPKDPAELADYEAIVTVRERTHVTREFLAKTCKLKHLAVTGRLSGQVDLDELKRRGISASYTDGSGQSAAELTISLILGITKGLHFRHHVVQIGGWQTGLATGLSGKTLGVLGLGRIGTKVALFGKLMEMNVISWGPTGNQDTASKLGIARMDLRDVLRQSDILSICLRLSEKTRHLLRKEELAQLRPGTYLVNTARAEIIEKSALYSELTAGRISAALDVYHEEPLPGSDPLRALPNVLLSPHMGYVTTEVYETFFSQVVENLLAWKSGKSFRNALEAR